MRNNHNSSADYFDEMSRPHTYGRLCELVAARQLYLYLFEVYHNGNLTLRRKPHTKINLILRFNTS